MNYRHVSIYKVKYVIVFELQQLVIYRLPVHFRRMTVIQHVAIDESLCTICLKEIPPNLNL